MVGKKDKEGEKKNRSFRNAIDLPETERFLTGFPSLDAAIGGGIVIRSIVEISGDESEGKTTLGFQLLGKAQREGYKCIFIDAEHSTLKEYLGKFLDLKTLEISEPVTAEETFQTIREFYEDNREVKNMILVDSVAALSPLREVEEGSPRIAELAGILSEQLRGNVLRNYRNSIVVFTNQVRSKMDLRNPNARVTVTPGGYALKFYAGYRLNLDTVSMIIREIGAKKESLGKTIAIDVKKNKFGRPFQRCQLDLFFGQGFSRESDLITFGVEKGIIQVDGSWITYGELKVQGKYAMLEKVINDQELRERLEHDCSTATVVRKALT